MSQANFRIAQLARPDLVERRPELLALLALYEACLFDIVACEVRRAPVASLWRPTVRRDLAPLVRVTQEWFLNEPTV